MGSYDGAELCELVGLYILNKLKDLYGIDTCGLYRDDGLGCFRKRSPRIFDRLKSEIKDFFLKEFELKITIEANLDIVNFLDIIFDLKRQLYKPYSKPNRTILLIL